MPQYLIDYKSTQDQVIAWCHQAPSYYLSHCWHRSIPYGTPRLYWVNSSVLGLICDCITECNFIIFKVKIRVIKMSLILKGLTYSRSKFDYENIFDFERISTCSSYKFGPENVLDFEIFCDLLHWFARIIVATRVWQSSCIELYMAVIMEHVLCYRLWYDSHNCIWLWWWKFFMCVLCIINGLTQNFTCKALHDITFFYWNSKHDVTV